MILSYFCLNILIVDNSWLQLAKYAYRHNNNIISTAYLQNALIVYLSVVNILDLDILYVYIFSLHLSIISF